jgi:hypothetical protein
VKTAVFTPTYRYGGLDVASASILRQSIKPDFWIVADEIFDQRQDTWEIIEQIVFDKGVSILFIEPHQPVEDAYRNLVAAYNAAAEVSSNLNIDLFISMQDYMWVPEQGIERFVELHKLAPNDLLTGITHISADPFASTIQNPTDGFSLWEESYLDKPKRIHWIDSRIDLYSQYPEDQVIEIDTVHWEANWAAVPVSLFNKGLRWDAEYDKGIAYENMDLAARSRVEFGSRVLIDRQNVAISLPHKEYFEGEKEAIIEHSNRERFEKKWGQPC